MLLGLAFYVSVRVRGQVKEKMDYVSIDQFNQGWNFFTKDCDSEYMDGKFPCSEFSCSGCDDWLDADNQNRNVYKL